MKPAPAAIIIDGAHNFTRSPQHSAGETTMQSEQSVNVHARLLRASARTSGDSDNMQSQLHDGEFEPAKTGWRGYFQWEALTVAGRSIEKGFVVTPTMGLTLILAIASIVGTMYWRTGDAITGQRQEMREIRDMTIRMETRLDERTNYQREAESKREREQNDNEEIAKVWRETITQRMNDIDKKRR